MGREKWAPTPEQIVQVEKMSGLGLKTEQIATLHDVSKDTFERAAKRIPELRAALEKGREKAQLSLTSWAMESARKGNVAMQIFLLKTRCGYRETERVELTGADGAPLMPKKEMSVEEALKVMAKYDRILSRQPKKA